MSHHPIDHCNSPVNKPSKVCTHCDGSGWQLHPSKYEDGLPCLQCNPKGKNRKVKS